MKRSIADHGFHFSIGDTSLSIPTNTNRIRSGETTTGNTESVSSRELFSIDYSKSNRDRCAECGKKIMQKEIRVGKIVGAREILIPPRYHVACFASAKQKLEFYNSGGALVGIDALSVEDQAKVMEMLPKMAPGSKKRKIENDEREKDEVEMFGKKLNDLSRHDLIDLLEANKQDIPKETKIMVDRLSDCMAFGALQPCSVCKNGQLEFRPGIGYYCLGLDQWANCESVFDEPERRPFIVPAKLKNKYAFLMNYRHKETGKRLFVKKGTPFAKSRLAPIATSTPETCYEFGKTKKKFRIKDGVAVDPQFSHPLSSRVYRDVGGNTYSVYLTLTDVQARKNMFYKMQILETEASECVAPGFVFSAQSWGRIGSRGTRSEMRMGLTEAVRAFERVFFEQTGNSWNRRNAFKKVPGKKVMLDISYGRNDPDSVRQSKLEKPVQDLVTLIYNRRFMIQTVKEMELDLDKMPLGKLSKKQIQEAYDVLKKLQDIITAQGETEVNQKTLISFTNEFYSLIPHNFGASNAPLLCTLQAIQRKTKILDTLQQIELAYSLSLKQSDKNNADPEIDLYYDRLNTNIRTMERTDPEFKMLEKCVKNTHCHTHKSYTLEIVQIFKVERHGEDERYARFKNLHNRRLLWHGSRLTNFVGILSQGLRIAPPEAPSSGYMFGKGIYFADMVSKAANYCKPSMFNNNGLLLLCEVALGDMDLSYTAQSQTVKPKVGFHSIKGVGRTKPVPKKARELADGVVIQLGKGVPHSVDPPQPMSLHYNEYIVYDPAQVKIRYLLQVKFNFVTQLVS